MTHLTLPFSVAALLTVSAGGFGHAAEPPRDPRDTAPVVTFQSHERSLTITIGQQQIAEYVLQDDQVLRPYFRHLRTRSGIPVTRTHPPVPGKDLDDHPTMHPGLWLAFGDLNGADFWRNKGHVRHLRYRVPPTAGPDGGMFAAENVYEADGQIVCTETFRCRISVQPAGYRIDWHSTFRPQQQTLTFGDQEEMGLGVRVATPLAVKKGGELVNSAGGHNEKAVWGKQADWCQYSGAVANERVGILLMPAGDNFRRSWFHARDYGLLVANPFGVRAFTRAAPEPLTVQPGSEFSLRFGISVFGVTAGEEWEPANAYRTYLKELSAP